MPEVSTPCRRRHTYPQHTSSVPAPRSTAWRQNPPPTRRHIPDGSHHAALRSTVIVRGQQCAEARPRGGAGQLFSGGGQGRGADVVTAEPSWVAKRPQTLRPGRGLAAQRVVAGREDVRAPATPVVALSASSVRG